DAAHPQEVVVGRIAADEAEIHGARVVAVDAFPGLAAVGGHVEPAVLIAVGSLLLVQVGPLAAEAGGERARALLVVGAAAGAVARTLAGGGGGALGELDLHRHALALAGDFELDGVAGHVLADLGHEVVVGLHGLGVDGDDDVVGLEVGGSGGAVLDDVG